MPDTLVQPRKRYRKPKKSKLGLVVGLALVVLFGLFVAALDYSRPHVEGDRLLFSQYMDLVESGQVRTATILDVDSYAVGTYLVNPPSTPAETSATPELREYNVPLARMTQGQLLMTLVNLGVETEVDQQTAKQVASLATTLVPGLILVLLFVYLILSYRRGTGLFGLRSGAQKFEASEGSASFADVAGQEAAVTELKEIRDYLSDPERFAALGAAVPKGILLFGPPGCGKTLLARAVANEAGASFYSISGSDFVELYVGVGAARVRELFKEARENVPAIVFIDEIDSVGRRRSGGGPGGGGGGSREEQEQALNQILTAMDGFSPLEGLIVIGATNRPDILDPALLRPGRFDRTIGLESPDEDGRLAILGVHARQKPVDPGADLRAVAHRSVGLSGADLAGVMNEAALLAARAGRPAITQIELDEALKRILEAPERQRRLSMRGHTFGRSTGGGDGRVTFSDVAGVDEAIAELGEVKEYLTDPERFVRLGAKPPRGFLLVGPPGCGKTLLAKAVAVESNAAFFSVAATELVEVFVGEGASRVRDLFAEARAAAPAIVFLDEVDAIGARRGVSIDGGREREQTLNQILIELDGFHARSGVTVLAATNRPEILDEALVRPGRFDRTVVINLPDRASRHKILAVHAKDKLLDDSVDLEVVANMTQGFSGADLANIMNEAALLAARHHRQTIPMEEVEEAVERVGVGIARAQRLTDEDRTIVAYHEVGHALVTRALMGPGRLHKISLVARGHALGVAWQTGEASRAVHPKSALVDRMATLLGGRAAEELVFGEPASGAADDLRRVSDMARQMVCEFGMSESLGQLTYNGDAAVDSHSGRVADSIDAEVRALVDEAYARAKAVLGEARRVLDEAAQALLERETLSAAELEEITGPLPAPYGRPGARPKRPARALR